MALKLSSSFSILFVLLLLVFPHVLARQMVKDQGSKEADVSQFNDDKHGGGYYGHGHGGGGYGHGCRYYCGRRCCSAAEYAEFVNKKATADGLRRDKCCFAAGAEFTKQGAGQH